VPNFSALALCPANRPNLIRFGLPPASLSRRGVAQLLQLGDAVRRRYALGAGSGSGGEGDVAFMPPYFEGGASLRLGFGAHFRAAHAPRCLQSAAAMAHALYPTASAAGHATSFQPVPVESRHVDTLLDATADRDNGCHAAQARERRRFGADGQSSGGGDGGGSGGGGGIRALLAPRRVRALLGRLSLACGGPALLPAALADAGVIKTLSDMLAFDAAEGHRHTPTNGPRGAAGGAVAGAMVSEADTAALHALAAAVVRRRDFATAAQRQRWLGRLPKKLKACMRAARSRAEWDAAPNAFEGDAGEGGAEAAAPTPRHLLYSYHGHRELLIALMQTLGIDPQDAVRGYAAGRRQQHQQHQHQHQHQQQALVLEQLPPATTLFFELHAHDGSASGRSGARRLKGRKKKRWVKALLWLPPPYCTASEGTAAAAAACIVEVRMRACKGKCHLKAFEHVFKRLQAETGGWKATCSGGSDGDDSDDDDAAAAAAAAAAATTAAPPSQSLP
jgi:hypothetical protein